MRHKEAQDKGWHGTLDGAVRWAVWTEKGHYGKHEQHGHDWTDRRLDK